MRSMALLLGKRRGWGSAVPQAACTLRCTEAEPDSVVMALQAHPEKFKKDLVNRLAMKFDHTVYLNYFQT